jgi:hypothetical protein
MTRSASSQDSPFRLNTPESHLLNLLRDGGAHTVEELLNEAPEFSWAQLFVAMDSLSRRGMIELRRAGFTYWLKKAGPWGAADVSDPHC